MNDRGIVVNLIVDRAGRFARATELTGITGYRIYRTPLDGAAGRDEVLLASVTRQRDRVRRRRQRQRSARDKPLAPGSTSAWQALPVLNTARNQLRGVAAPIRTPRARSICTRCSARTAARTTTTRARALASYEYLTRHAASERSPDRGHLDAAGRPASAPGASTTARGWPTVASRANIADGSAYIYVSGGRDGAGNAALVGSTEAATVGNDGSLSASRRRTRRAPTARASAWPPPPAACSCSAAGPRARSATTPSRCASPRLRPRSRSASTAKADSSVGEPRFMPGSALQSAFIFIVGGQTDTRRRRHRTRPL